MRDFIVFGTGDFADIVSWVIVNGMKRKVKAFTANRKYIGYETIHRGYPLVPFEDIEKIYCPDEYSMVIAYEGKEMYKQRRSTFEKAVDLGYKMENIISDSAIISTDRMGNGNIILEGCIVAPFSEIGNGNILWSGAIVQHHNRVGNFNVFGPRVSPSGFVEIGNHCFLGNGAIIKNRVKISDYSFIGAGAYLSKDTTEREVVVPSRSYVLKNRESSDFY